MKENTMMYFDAFTSIGLKQRMHRAEPYTLKHLISEMEHCSISGAMVSVVSTITYDPMQENLRLSKMLEKHKNLFPIWNAMPHWTGEFLPPEEFIEALFENKVCAVMLNPISNGWNITSSTSMPLLKMLQYYKILTIFDCSKEISFEDLEAILKRFPELPVLLVGVYWNKQRYVYPLLMKYSNLHIAFDHLQTNNGVEWLVSRGCENQLVYASYATSMSMGAHRSYIDYADLDYHVREKIASGNLKHLVKDLAPPKVYINPNEDELMREARNGGPLSCTVLDFHSHILDEGLHGAGGSYTMINGGPSGVLNLAKRMGVDGVGIMSWHGPCSAMADSGNACTKAALKSLPDTYWGLYTLDAVHESPDNIERKLKRLFSDPHFLGFKPYPAYGLDYDAPEYKAWWKFGNKYGLYALIHPIRNDFSEFDDLCRKYPNMTFIAAHCGGSYATADKAIKKAQKYDNFYAEVTLTPVCMGIIDYLAKGCGVDKVLYGSDQPMRDPRQQLGWVVYSRLSVESKKKILGLNAQKILKKVRSYKRGFIK